VNLLPFQELWGKYASRFALQDAEDKMKPSNISTLRRLAGFARQWPSLTSIDASTSHRRQKRTEGIMITSRPGRMIVPAIVFVVLFVCAKPACAQMQAPSAATRIEVDTTRAPQKIIHSHMEMPVRAGPLDLSYPEWIPGEHEPSGPVVNVAGIKFIANGKAVAWKRDPVDMYSIHLEVPPGTTTLDVDLDFLLSSASSGFSSGASASAFLNLLSWNQVVLFPKGADAAKLTYVPSLRLPDAWKYGTALPGAKQNGNVIDFAPVSLETLIDSPVLSGRYFRVIDLTPGQTPTHEMDLAADSAAALDVPPARIAAYRQLVAEAGALFGARHYRDYHFLVSLSDTVAHFGLEHHESSDDRTYEHFLTDDKVHAGGAYLLSHEYVHSWNGKYRRPEGLLSPDYTKPMKDDLLWGYEGLTDYLGEVLAARSGLWTNEQAREYFARTAAILDSEPGRSWRPLQDTATGAVFLYQTGDDWSNWRRSVDFYGEGDFLWLGVDAMIRKLTNDKKSLNDFCRLFEGGATGQPDLKSYNFEDVVDALSEVTPYDWATYLRTRLDELSTNTVDEALSNSGWKLIYTDQPNEIASDRDKVRKQVDLRLTLGLLMNTDGSVADVIYDGPSFKAGIGPGMKLVAIDGRQIDAESMADTANEEIARAKGGSAPIQLLVANGDDVQMHALDYHGGLRYPHLVRDESKPDYFGDVLKPLAPAAK
jgi:predicted metalloprotease with PDZ domain